MLGLLYDAIDSVAELPAGLCLRLLAADPGLHHHVWVRLPYSVWLNRIQRFLYDVCDPYLRLWRRILPTFGPLDLSPVVGVLALYILLAIVTSILDRLH